LGETFLLMALAVAATFVLAEIFLPAYETFLEKKLITTLFQSSWFWAGTVGFVILVGICAGSYPAFVLSSYQPMEVLKGRFQSSAAGQFLRKALVVAQFGVSVMLVIGAVTVYEQLRFMKTRALGFNKDQMLVVEIGATREAIQKAETVKNDLRRLTGVVSVAASHSVPSRGLVGRTSRPEGEQENETRVVETLMVDHDFLSVYGIPLVAGRGFDKEMATDQTTAFIINETAAREFGWTVESAIGKKFQWGTTKSGEIIGVTKDFHFRSLQESITPIVMHVNAGWYNYFSLRISGGRVEETIAAVENYWSALFPNRPFNFFFLDEEFDRQYRAEQKSGEIVGAFSFLAIFLACLGLFGLAAYSAEQRTKEIGIRKVLGATVANIMVLLSKDFVKLVVIANFCAWPLAYFAMNRWLQDFAYRVDLGWWMFALAGGIALLIALLTVSTQAIKAALANPVEALRYE
ncbi:MAG: ABC transporter permease, partial [bacterium]